LPHMTHFNFLVRCDMRPLSLVGGYRRFTASSSFACAHCTSRDVNGVKCCIRVPERHTRSDVCLLGAYWSFSGFKFPNLSASW
jgi:hypothetical protein